MRKRILLVGAVLSLTIGVLTAPPAAAAYVVAITFPGGASEFYSPFGGPATVTFTFPVGEPDATFNVRLRPAGGSAIKTTDRFVNGDDPDGTNSFNFSWPDLNVTNPKTYEVAVYRNGNFVTSESFQLRPKLVAITGASPNPFLPWIDDGIKDTTTVKFDLAADADAEARVYRPNSAGNCCGTLVRTDTLNGLSAGQNTWVWDGQGDGAFAGNLAKGDYFVRIWADDGLVAPAISKPWKVTISRTYRALTTLEKNGIKYHHTGPVTSYRRGGNCFVTQDETDQDLWITCLSASFTVYWRWALPNGGRVEKASFVFVHVSSEICNGKKGHTKTDSYLKVGGVGQFRCRIDKAKITYSVPQPS